MIRHEKIKARKSLMMCDSCKHTIVEYMGMNENAIEGTEIYTLEYTMFGTMHLLSDYYKIPKRKEIKHLCSKECLIRKINYVMSPTLGNDSSYCIDNIDKMKITFKDVKLDDGTMVKEFDLIPMGKVL